MRDAFADLVLGSTCLGCGRPGRPVCPVCAETLPTSAEDAFPARPEPPPDGLAPVTVAADYAGLVRALVVRHKEERALGLVRPLASLLAVAVGAVLRGIPGPAVRIPAPVLVPVPSRPAVVRARGHDPLARIVRRAAREVRGPPVADLVRQVRRTGDQSGLDATERAANLRGALTVRPGVMRRLPPVTAIVCDDVVTTGSTAREAQRALEEAGIPVVAIAAIAATRLRRDDGNGTGR